MGKYNFNIITEQKMEEHLLNWYDKEESFPPRPARTLRQLIEMEGGFGEAFQLSLDKFLYKGDGFFQEIKIVEGLERTKEIFELLFDFGVLQIGFANDDSDACVLLLLWQGGFYSVVDHMEFSKGRK